MAFIESVEDTFDDVKKAVGEKGFLILGLVVVALFIIVLIKQNSSGGQVTVATGITSYPDVVTNANVIIDSLQKSITYSESEIREDLGMLSENVTDYYNDTQQLINDKSAQTNEYMKEGFGKQEELLSKGFESMSNQIDYTLDSIMTSQSNMMENIDRGFNDMRVENNMILNEMNQGFQATHLATALQIEQAEMNIRNDVAESTVKLGK